MHNDFYRKNLQTVYEELNTSSQGLSTSDVEASLLKYGKNKLLEPKRRSKFRAFIEQMMDPMIIVLLIAAILSLATSLYAGESFADVFIILFVVVLNSILGVIQESKAEDAIAALKAMTSAKAKVFRDNNLLTVPSEELVPGDIIVLEAGDSVPADARIIEEASLKVEESALTGESVAVSKTSEIMNIEDSDNEISLGDRKNMIYMGSSIVYGRAKAVVVATGMSTEMGQIAGAINDAHDEMTPLQLKLAELSKILTKIVLLICVAIFAVGLIKSHGFSIESMIDTFMLAISLAVAAIPEGLVAVVTIVLSIGVTKMAKQSAIIRRLTAVETLGCAEIICSDKTGTLTQNKMTVVDHFCYSIELLASGMALCSDAEINNDASTPNAVGEPTEAALVNFAFSKDLNKNDLSVEMPRIGEAPFDSTRKMMSTVHTLNDKNSIFEDNKALESFASKHKFIQFTKGAPDVILSHCSSVLVADGIVPIQSSHREKINGENVRMAKDALRVLALAIRFYDNEPIYKAESLEDELIFVGLLGMIDPIRPEVLDAISECRNAGIRPIMITGDQLDTAVAIGKKLGIIESSQDAILGMDLNKYSDEELTALVRTYSVYARVQPEHKVRIVKAWRANKKVTAMTGDGVNDAPAIKSADIGIGMGITGTDVTKNVSDMILADDNFATIVKAVEEGRRIYANIRKSIQFLLATNISEVLSILTATLLNFTILKPAHLLWINLITDSLPALALGMEPGESNTMKRKPRSSKDSIFADGMAFDIFYQGLITTILVLTAYFIGEYIETGVWHITMSNDGITMAFLTMSMCEIFHSLNMRSLRGSIFNLGTRNLWLILSSIAALVLTTIVIEVPFLAGIFGFTEISIKEYFIALGLAFLIIPLVEIIKLIKRNLNRGK